MSYRFTVPHGEDPVDARRRRQKGCNGVQAPMRDAVKG